MIKITFRTMWKILTVRIKRLYCCVKKHPKVVITPLVFSVNCHLDVPFSKFHFTFAEDRYYQAVETTTIELRESRNSRNQPWIQNDLKSITSNKKYPFGTYQKNWWVDLNFSSIFQFLPILLPWQPLCRATPNFHLLSPRQGSLPVWQPLPVPIRIPYTASNIGVLKTVVVLAKWWLTIVLSTLSCVIWMTPPPLQVPITPLTQP